jgi:phytoene synthase
LLRKDDALAERFVRGRDRDRYFAGLFAPKAKRAGLFALHAYDLTLLDVLQTTTEPQIGLIRLAWWRDAVSGPPVAGQPVLEALRSEQLDTAALAELAEAYMDRVEDGQGGSGAALFRVAAALLEGSSEVAGLGAYWQAAGERRAGTAIDEPPIEPIRIEVALRPVTALVAAARRDFDGRIEPRGSTRRQVAMLRHVLTGRL